MKLTIIVPVFNEAKTVGTIINSLKQIDTLGLEKEIVIVDDGSTDGSTEIIKKFNRIRFLKHEQNLGKGAAIKTGLLNSSGDIIIIQDADLEYSTSEIPKLIEPILAGKAEIVYGSRFKGKVTGKQLILHNIGNRLLSFAISLLFFQRISDMETGYKAFRRSVLKGTCLESKGFGFEAEFTAKALRKGYKILEIPISYHARTFEQGKKICWLDGIQALKILVKERFGHSNGMFALPDGFSSKTYYNENPLVRWYFFKLLKTAVKVSGVKEGDTVLDFGCNVQMLKRFLPKGVSYYGYDVKKVYTDLEDYSTIRPDVVFAINVFEHLTLKEFGKTLENFHSMKVKVLAVANPTSNFLSKLLQNFTGISKETNVSHLLTYEQVKSNLESFGWRQNCCQIVLSFNEVGRWIQ